jgi:hypothetical protein
LQEDVLHDCYFSPNTNAAMKDIWEELKVAGGYNEENNQF